MNISLEHLETEAVNAAIAGNWSQAVTLNTTMLQSDPTYLPALLRLGFAQLQLKNYEAAQEAYHKVLELQPTNTIAKENIDKIAILKTTTSKHVGAQPNPNLFIEIVGKTKVVALINLGQKDVLATLHVGQPVVFDEKKHHLEIRTEQDEYVGALPDDVSKRIMYMMKSESEYSLYIKEASLSKVTIFIREDKKGKKVAGFLSFPMDMQSNLGKLQAQSERSEDDELDHHVPHEFDEEEERPEEDDSDTIAKLEFEQLADNLEALEEQAKDMALANAQEDDSEDDEE